MIFEYPDLVRSFTCIADRCPDTCCRGWEVDIDSETEQYYRSVPGPLGERLRHALSVSEEDGSTYFPLTEEKRPVYATSSQSSGRRRSAACVPSIRAISCRSAATSRWT